MQVLPHKPLSYEYQPKYPHYLTHRHARAHTRVCSYRLWGVPCPGSACRSYRCRSPERVWSSTCTPPHRSPLPHTRSQTDPEGEKHFFIWQHQSLAAAHCHQMLRIYLLDVVDTAKTPSPRKRPEDLHLAVLTFGECLVEAMITGWTNLQVGKIRNCFRCQWMQWQECNGGISLPGGGIHTTTCGWCTQTPFHRGSHLLPCSYSAGSLTGRPWRSEPFLSVDSPAKVAHIAGKVNFSPLKQTIHY